ncbi:DUF2953 domain-containing protein [Clostridium sp. DJ247]|uniref:DUF2953 domain-containing protein n=1 Tax=Clostridium sp. DJ247 TaxID=2726188 RepID=UPI00162ABFC8|nr:DUF2953 domain-containing protein [Clostridium sp. DJ247]MBC2580350.1 DUF2953 domain-containing protein [Clostridium sp. DJ247]
MFFTLVFLILLFIVLFFPIPIKISIKYLDRKLDIRVYKINIDKILLKTRLKVKRRVEYKEDQRPILLNTLKILLKSLRDIKYKLNLRVTLNLIYGLEDAAYTALIYGILCSFCPIFLQLLSLVFNLKDPHLNIHPEYNKNTLRLEINSIIYTSLAKIIYISVIVYKNLHKNRKINLANT